MRLLSAKGQNVFSVFKLPSSNKPYLYFCQIQAQFTQMYFQRNAILLMHFHQLLPSNSPFTLLFCCVFPCGSTQQCSINNDILLLENIKCHHSVFSKASSLILLCILAIMNLREVWTIFRSIWKKYDRALFSDVSPLDINHFWHSLDHVCTSIFSNSTVSSSLVASEMAF